MAIIDGTAGGDKIVGTIYADLIRGFGGNDSIFAGAADIGFDTIFGGAGNDIIAGGGGNDNLLGDAGNDTIWGGGGNDFIVGGIGWDSRRRLGRRPHRRK